MDMTYSPSDAARDCFRPIANAEKWHYHLKAPEDDVFDDDIGFYYVSRVTEEAFYTDDDPSTWPEWIHFYFEKCALPTEKMYGMGELYDNLPFWREVIHPSWLRLMAGEFRAEVPAPHDLESVDELLAQFNAFEEERAQARARAEAETKEDEIIPPKAPAPRSIPLIVTGDVAPRETEDDACPIIEDPEEDENDNDAARAPATPSPRRVSRALLSLHSTLGPAWTNGVESARRRSRFAKSASVIASPLPAHAAVFRK